MGKLRLEVEVELWDRLEEVYGIVAIDYHGGLRSCRLFGHKNPTGPAYFAPQTSTSEDVGYDVPPILLLLALIHPSAWNRLSANFAFTQFYVVR